MPTGLARRMYLSALVAASLLLAASSASAQYKPKPVEDPATGESYHIEGAAGFWFPSANLQIASTQFGLIGTQVDFKNDLGLQDQHFSELHLTLRPVKPFKLRFQYIPIK